MPEPQRCVIPVVDYEPPLPAAHPAPRTPSPAQPTDRSTTAPDSPVTRQTAAATAFADAMLRRLLEVLDRRRPLAQLRPFLAAGLLESLLPASGRRDHANAAHLRRVRVQLIGTGTAATTTAAEVAASYARGSRIRAIACRIEQVPTVTGARWQVVALHLG